MITKKDLLKYGFERIDDPDGIVDELYVFAGVEIWQYDNYWIIDILDQNNIDVEYTQLAELNKFFKAIDQPFIK